jgi:tRNA (guanine9-N1)-methyltransferase
MSSQLTRYHAENRKSLKPVEIFLTGLNGKLNERMETAMRGVHHQWRGVHIAANSYEDVFPDVALEDFVYLTADSENIIQSLETGKVYIIGGLVDRNRHKVLISFFFFSSEHVLIVGHML